MINSVVLVGRLTRDPDLRKTQTGKSRLVFSVACRRRFVQAGQQGGDTDFINCVAWGRTAENMAQFLHKGSMIGVEGRISTRSYDNPQGQRVYVTEVVADNVTFLDSRSDSQAGAGYQSGYSGGYGQNQSGYGNQQGYGSANGNYSSYGSNSFGAQGYGQSRQGNSQDSYQSNPYSSPMNDALSGAFDDDDDSFDLETDDLPF